MKKNKILKAIMQVYYTAKVNECAEKAEKAYAKNDIDNWYMWTEQSWVYVKKYHAWL